LSALCFYGDWWNNFALSLKSYSVKIKTLFLDNNLVCSVLKRGDDNEMTQHIAFKCPDRPPRRVSYLQYGAVYNFSLGIEDLANDGIGNSGRIGPVVRKFVPH
jgi:hypothetical protein